MSEKVKARFGLLDALIILIIAAVIAFAAWYLNRGSGGEAAEITYTVEFSGVKKSFEGYPKPGDVVYDSIKGYRLGVITEVWYEPSVFYQWNHEEKAFREVHAFNEINCYITVSSPGQVLGDTITVGADEVDLRVGKLLYVKGKGYASQGYVVALNDEKEGV